LFVEESQKYGKGESNLSPILSHAGKALLWLLIIFF